MRSIAASSLERQPAGVRLELLAQDDRGAGAA